MALNEVSMAVVLRWFTVLVFAAAAFAAIVMLAGPVAAMAVLCGVLWIALLRTSRRVRVTRTEAEDLQAEQREHYESIISVLTGAIGLRDSMTAAHARRLAGLASVVAWQMGLRKDQVKLVEQAAILHDIGKMGISEDVFLKAGSLTEQEWIEMKRHPELGYAVLSSVSFLDDVAEVTWAHHERFDGTGYPRGLKGGEIPQAARIFALLDAYAAMTSARPYREPMPHQKAVEEIVRNSGTQFDPEVVQAFLDAERRGLIQEDGADTGGRTVSPSAPQTQPPVGSNVTG